MLQKCRETKPVIILVNVPIDAKRPEILRTEEVILYG